MPLFEDLGKRLSEVAKSAGKMTRDVAETTRINLQINTRQEEIEKCYVQLGKAYYARQTAGGGSTEAMDALCGQISEMIAECEDLQKQVDDLKGQRRCPNCGSIQSATSSFCSDCGERLSAEKPSSPAEGVTITWPEAATEVKGEAAKPDQAEPQAFAAPAAEEAPETAEVTSESCECGCAENQETECECADCAQASDPACEEPKKAE